MVLEKHKRIILTALLGLVIIIFMLTKSDNWLGASLENNAYLDFSNTHWSNFFLQSKLHINDGSSKWTPLHQALYLKDTLAIRLLLEAGASPDVEDSIGRTPLHHACSLGLDLGVALLLAHGALVKIRDHKGYCPIHLAAGKNRCSWNNISNYTHIVAMLLEHGAQCDVRDDRGRTPLHYASMYGSLDVVKLLIRHGADVLLQDWHQATPLHYAAGRVKNRWVNEKDYTAIAQELITHGAHDSCRDNAGKNPLHYACSYGNVAIIDMLFKNNLCSMAQDFDGATPLHYACGKDTVRFKPLRYNPFMKTKAQEHDYQKTYEKSEKGHVSAVKKLLSHGARSMEKDRLGNLPVDYALSNRHSKIINFFECVSNSDYETR